MASPPHADVPLILEGGAGTLQHIADAFRAGADAVALGTMLVFGDNNILKIKRYLKAQGIAVRL
jgi:cyclase